MEIISLKPLLIILVSAVAGFCILGSGDRPNVREFWTFLAAGLKFLLVLSLFPLVAGGQIVVFKFFEILPGVTASLRVDALGLFFALVASGLWIITSLYSVGYMRTLKEHEQTRYFFSFALSLSATMGIAFAGDLFTFFVFFEMLTLATYPLVAHKETKEAIQAGRKYLVYSLGAAAVFLFAIAWIYTLTGTLQFTPGGFAASITDRKTLTFLFFLFVYGGAVKAALFPFHAWLPSAMIAPTPVSALLHAVAVVKAGVFAILRIVGYVFGPGLLKSSDLWQPLAWIAAFTILFASVMALAQDNLKRRLAYSTISQLSYIILGAALVTPSAYLGSMLHLSNHALMKITLFFCAGVIYAKLHKENISEMQGIGRVIPWTLAAFAIGAVGLSGFPPFCGLISKWFLVKGSLDAGTWLGVVVYLSSALLNAAYLIPVVIIAFSPSVIARSPGGARNDREIALSIPAIITAALAILFGILPWAIGYQMKLPELAVQQIFGV